MLTSMHNINTHSVHTAHFNAGLIWQGLNHAYLATVHQWAVERCSSVDWSKYYQLLGLPLENSTSNKID